MHEPIETTEIPNNKKSGYFAKHWYGKQSLAKSYWINYWLLSIIITIGVTVLAVYGENKDPVWFARLTLLVIVVIYIVIYPWQIVGLWRSANNSTIKTGKTFWPRVVKFIIIIGLLGNVASELQEKELYKDLYFQAFNLAENRNYDVDIDNNIIVLNGDLDYGISDKVEKLLKKNDSIKFIILNSDGGLLYEAHKLSKLIMLNSLNTYTNKGCYSACTIAFISGNKRFIHKDSNLGFHQYSAVRPSFRPDKATIYDLISEQKDDEKFFQKRGIDKAFTDHMYKYEADDMWYPNLDDLKYYGVIDGVIGL